MSRHNQLTVTCEIGKKYDAMKKAHEVYLRKYTGETDLKPTDFAKEFVNQFRKGDIIKSWNGGTTASLSLMVNHGNIRISLEDLQPFFKELLNEDENFLRSHVYGFSIGEEEASRTVCKLDEYNDAELVEDVLFRKVHGMDADVRKSNRELSD